MLTVICRRHEENKKNYERERETRQTTHVYFHIENARFPHPAFYRRWRLDLRGSDLRGADLREAHLEGAIF